MAINSTKELENCLLSDETPPALGRGESLPVYNGTQSALAAIAKKSGDFGS